MREGIKTALKKKPKKTKKKDYCVVNNRILKTKEPRNYYISKERLVNTKKNKKQNTT